MPKYDKPPAYRLVQRRDGSFNVLPATIVAPPANSIAVVATPVTSSGPNPPPPSSPESRATPGHARRQAPGA
jgi:hypothetical protein